MGRRARTNPITTPARHSTPLRHAGASVTHVPRRVRRDSGVGRAEWGRGARHGATWAPTGGASHLMSLAIRFDQLVRDDNAEPMI